MEKVLMFILVALMVFSLIMDASACGQIGAPVSIC